MREYSPARRLFFSLVQFSMPLAIYYEHPLWFRPLFAELDRRGIAYEIIDAKAPFFFDPAESDRRYSVLFNRMSPSAYLRDGGSAIFHTLNFLAHLERVGTRVINGRRAFSCEISKARQLTLLAELGLPGPGSRVIHRAADAPAAAEGLRFPVVVKANVGGSGAGIVRYDSLGELIAAARTGTLELGLDRVALVQEFIPARDGHITRVETLGGKFLYAINVFPEAGSFDLCPADACQTKDGATLERTATSACLLDAPKRGLRVAATEVPDDVREACERIARHAAIDVGGIESMIDDRDGQRVYYDINALSNFVADAPRVIGFDPHARLVDFLETELRKN
jgi:glutathione synthase/RimK-type ligase-like ATP-grasp enzyme